MKYLFREWSGGCSPRLRLVDHEEMSSVKTFQCRTYFPTKTAKLAYRGLPVVPA